MGKEIYNIINDMLRKYLVEYQSINNCGNLRGRAMINQNNVKLSHRKYIS